MSPSGDTTSNRSFGKTTPLISLSRGSISLAGLRSSLTSDLARLDQILPDPLHPVHHPRHVPKRLSDLLYEHLVFEPLHHRNPPTLALPPHERAFALL